MAFNTLLKIAIVRSGKTQTTIAKAAGMSESLLSRIIHGHHEPTAEQKREIARALRCKVDDLFTEAAA